MVGKFPPRLHTRFGENYAFLQIDIRDLYFEREREVREIFLLFVERKCCTFFLERDFFLYVFLYNKKGGLLILIG